MLSDSRHGPKGKKLTPQAITGQLGANLIERIVLEMKCIWRPLLIFDLGIDGEIEICDPASGQATNSIVRVQAKATAQRFVAETDTTFEFACDQNDLDYWLCGNIPVILIICKPSSNEAYWVSIRDYFKDLSARKSGRVRFNKQANRFESSCIGALRELSLPKDAGIYCAPLHQSESLISNLLEVSSFSPVIFVADTEYREARELWAKLNSIATQVGSEWILGDKRLISFHDLSEHPFDKISDRGTCEEFDSREWADSNDPDRRWQFIRLLNQSLKQLAHRLRLRYHTKYEYYYFPSTRGLQTQHVSYPSIYRHASREVFKAYMKKDVPRDIAYCRHSAFSGRFLHTDDRWFLEITPTYHFSCDGRNEDFYREEHLKGIKRLERNPAVLGQVMMWSDYLRREVGDLFEGTYSFLSFGGLATLSVEASLPDDQWYSAEDASEKQDLSTRDNSLDLYDV